MIDPELISQPMDFTTSQADRGGMAQREFTGWPAVENSFSSGMKSSPNAPVLSYSIALDPLYPSRCSWETFGYATSTTMPHASDELTPLQLSGQLNSLPCSMSFRQEESTSIIRLIEQVSQTYPLSSFLYLGPPLSACSS